MMRDRGARWALALGLVLSLSCRSSASDERTLVVFAASSLTEAFTALESQFEAAHPGVDVRMTFAGSQVLRVQIEQGATADVFATANGEHLDALSTAGLTTGATTFAENELVIVVPPDNPAQVETLADLPRARRLVIGNPRAPVGAYTREMLNRAGDELATAVLARVVSEEPNVRMVRAKVELGEADAGVVYRTDALASKRVRTVPIDPSANVSAHYMIATHRHSADPRLAEAFVAFVMTPAAQSALRGRGFSAETPIP